MKKLITGFLVSVFLVMLAMATPAMATPIDVKYLGYKNWENINGMVAGEYMIETTDQKYDTFCFDPNNYAPPKNMWKVYDKVLPSNDSEKHALWVFDDYLGLISPTSNQAATYQAAIWSILNPSLDFSGDSDVIGGLYSSLLSSSGRNSEYYMLKSDCYQDFAIPNNPVPIPGAVWLLGSGLLTLLGFRRIKK